MIVCCGEALIDMIPVGGPEGVTSFGAYAGGAVFNTAIALGRLERPVQLLSGVSKDLFGQQLQEALAGSQVGTELLVRGDRPTTLAFVTLTNGHAKYAFYDENTAGRMMSEADLPPIPEDVQAMFFGGISLACEPGADAYAVLLERECTNRAIVMDPNIRAGFAPDETRYRSRLMSMMARADLVKVSDEDLDWIVRGDGNVPEKARALQATGPAVVLVTKGSEGAIGFLPSGDVVSVSAPSVEVADTVGAGDTFNAGVMAKLDELGKLGKSELRNIASSTLEEALAFGAQVAAVTVTRSGANPPWLRDLG